MLDSPKHVDQFLFDAIHTHSMRTRGQPATRVTLRYSDGSETTLPLPLHEVPVSIEAKAASSWPPPEGWAFRPGEAAFNGTRLKLCGKLLAILRELATRLGEPVRANQLKEVVWGEDPDMVEDGNLQGHVSLLRKRLRESLGLDLNPITHADCAYRLVVY